jgi:hypothetical protein
VITRIILAIILGLCLKGISKAADVTSAFKQDSTTGLVSVKDRSGTWAPIGTASSAKFGLNGYIDISGSASPIKDLYTGNIVGNPYPSPSQYFGVSSGGAGVSVSDITGFANGDHDRATVFIKTTTTADAGKAEASLKVNTVSETGASLVWAPSTSYTVNNIARTSAYVYKQTNASCTSASSGSGPTGTGTGIIDGTCLWNYINDSALSYKAGIYNGTVVKPGAAQTWGFVNNYIRAAGSDKSMAPGLELDYSGDSTDCVIGLHNCYNIFMGMNGGPGTGWIGMSGSNTGPYSAHYGILALGAKFADIAVFSEDTQAASGFMTGSLSAAQHSIAGFRDHSTSTRGFYADGTYTEAGFKVDSASTSSGFDCRNNPTFSCLTMQIGGASKGVWIGGPHTGNSIEDTSTAVATGVYLGGAYSDSAIRFNPSGTTLYGINASGTLTSSLIHDGSTAPVTLHVNGTNSLAGILMDGSSNVGIQISSNNIPNGIYMFGSGRLNDFYSASSAIHGIQLDGTYSGGAIRAASFKWIPVTVATLPTCNAGNQDLEYRVTDANAATYNSVVAGGGTNRINVICDGTNWREH